jgi:hypothetical protein
MAVVWVQYPGNSQGVSANQRGISETSVLVCQLLSMTCSTLSYYRPWGVRQASQARRYHTLGHLVGCHLWSDNYLNLYRKLLMLRFGPCHGSGGYWSVSHRGGPGLCPRCSRWNLRWTHWKWNRFFSDFFGFPLSVSFHRGSPHSYITWETNNRLVGGRSSETQSHPIDMNNVYWDSKRQATKYSP